MSKRFEVIAALRQGFTPTPLSNASNPESVQKLKQLIAEQMFVAADNPQEFFSKLSEMMRLTARGGSLEEIAQRYQTATPADIAEAVRNGELSFSVSAEQNLTPFFLTLIGEPTLFAAFVNEYQNYIAKLEAINPEQATADGIFMLSLITNSLGMFSKDDGSGAVPRTELGVIRDEFAERGFDRTQFEYSGKYITAYLTILPSGDVIHVVEASDNRSIESIEEWEKVTMNTIANWPTGVPYLARHEYLDGLGMNPENRASTNRVVDAGNKRLENDPDTQKRSGVALVVSSNGMKKILVGAIDVAFRMSRIGIARRIYGVNPLDNSSVEQGRQTANEFLTQQAQKPAQK